jgi:hypothetical protein
MYRLPQRSLLALLAVTGLLSLVAIARLSGWSFGSALADQGTRPASRPTIYDGRYEILTLRSSTCATACRRSSAVRSG